MVLDNDDNNDVLPDLSSFTSEDKARLIKIQAGARALLARTQQTESMSKDTFRQAQEKDLPTWSTSSNEDPERLTKVQAGAKGLLARKQKEEASKKKVETTDAASSQDYLHASVVQLSDKSEEKLRQDGKVDEDLPDLSASTSDDTARLVRIQSGARGLLARKQQRRNSAASSIQKDFNNEAVASELESDSKFSQVATVATSLRRLERLLQRQSMLLKKRAATFANVHTSTNRLSEILHDRKHAKADVSALDLGDRDSILDAISEKVEILEHAPDSLLNDMQFLMQAVMRKAAALKYSKVESSELERLAARRLRFQRLSGADIDVSVGPGDTLCDVIVTIASHLHCSDPGCIKLVLDGKILGEEEASSTVEELCLASFQMGGVGIVQVIQMARQQTQESYDASSQPPSDTIQHKEHSSLLEGATDRSSRHVGRLHVLGRCKRHSRCFEDDYEISTNALGQGVSGCVMQARRKGVQGSEDSYAVKALSLQQLSGAGLDVLKGEVEVFLSADHPHIVRLLDVYESTSTLHFVMECMKGGELFDRIVECPNNSGMREEDARELVRQMLLAVNYLHTHGIVHRDLKPENFLFDEKGSNHLKMIDFGFSKFVSEDELMRELLGTWAYAAPEVFTRAYTTQCDLWSIGVTLFVMLLGFMPFDDESPQLVDQITRGEFYKPDKWYEISPLAVDFLENLITVEPSRRLTAWKALSHPFIYEHGRPAQTVGIEVIGAFRKFASSTKLQKSSLEMLSWSLSSQERARVEEAFLAIDSDMSGTISRAELKDFLITQNYMGDGEFAAIAESLDYNGDGVICYAEFLAAMCSSTIHMHDHNLRDAFRRFDVDGSGYIGSSDLLQMLGETLGETAANELIAEADTDADKQISFAEFEALIKCGSTVTPGPLRTTFGNLLEAAA